MSDWAHLTRFFYTSFRGNYNESKPGEESREVSSFSTIQQDAPEGNNLTGGTEEQEEKHNITERLTPKDKLSEWESVNRELHGDEPSDAVEQDRLRILDSDNANAIDCLDVDHPDSEFTGISLGFSDDVACASPLTVAEDEGSQKGVLNKNIIDSNEKTEAEEQTEVFPHSGCPGVNVFEAQFEEIDNGMEGSAATGDRQKEGYEKPPHKDTSWLLFENLKSEHERPEGNKQQAEDQTETTEELQRLQTCSEETHDRYIEDSNTNKVDSSVEVSFEDLPEAQEITEFEEEQPEEQDAVEVLQTNMEMPPVEESKEIAAVAPDQKVSVTQDREHEMVGVETEANSEETEMKSQLETSVMKERVDTNDPNLSDEEDEMGEGDKVVSSSHQPTGTPESDNPEYENGHTHESSLKISEGESQQKEPNSEEAETTHVQNGDDERVSKQGRCKGGAENQSPQASQSNSSTGAPETETLETSVHHLSEEDKRGQGTALKAEPEVRVLEEPSESLELVEERTYDSKRQQDSRTSVKDSVSPDPPADEGEKGHSDKDTTGPEDSSGEKVPSGLCLSKEFNLKNRI